MINRFNSGNGRSSPRHVSIPGLGLGFACILGALSTGPSLAQQSPGAEGSGLTADAYDHVNQCLGFYDGAKRLLIRMESWVAEADAGALEDMIYDTELLLNTIAEAVDAANHPGFGFRPELGDARAAEASAPLDGAADVEPGEQFALLQRLVTEMAMEDCRDAAEAVVRLRPAG